MASMRRTIVAAILVAIIAVSTGCALLPGPEITCQEQVSAEDCDRAVDMARPLLVAYWDEASEALVHRGMCTRDMECSDRQRTFPDVLTVELVSAEADSASVVIDGRTADWTATCRLIVATANGAHSEHCAGS
jgi:hypothetical protein